jgi:hypothetical protein
MLRILDVGSGQIPKLISNYAEITVTSCDEWPSTAVALQDMEKLTYPDKSFNVVLCINALDHTQDALTALKEMIRVSRGLIYINCALDQMTRHHKKHYWDAKEDGRFVNPTGSFDLKDYGFQIEFENGRMIARKFNG